MAEMTPAQETIALRVAQELFYPKQRKIQGYHYTEFASRFLEELQKESEQEFEKWYSDSDYMWTENEEITAGISWQAAKGLK